MEQIMNIVIHFSLIILSKEGATSHNLLLFFFRPN